MNKRSLHRREKSREGIAHLVPGVDVCIELQEQGDHISVPLDDCLMEQRSSPHRRHAGSDRKLQETNILN